MKIGISSFNVVPRQKMCFAKFVATFIKICSTTPALKAIESMHKKYL